MVGPPDQEGTMPKLYSIKPPITLRGRRFMGLLRGFTGHPNHPPLTDFPVVCYVLAAACDVISVVSSNPNVQHDFFMAATINLVAGFVVSLGAALTGFMDWWKGLPRDRKSGPIGKAKHTQVWRTANWHMTVMLTVTVIVIVDLILRWGDLDQGQTPTVVMVLSVVAALLVAYGALYGGSLVYEFGFNVEVPDAPWKESEEDVYPGRKPTPPAEKPTPSGNPTPG
jgi:uncharacterized membrane protein